MSTDLRFSISISSASNSVDHCRTTTVPGCLLQVQCFGSLASALSKSLRGCTPQAFPTEPLNLSAQEVDETFYNTSWAFQSFLGRSNGLYDIALTKPALGRNGISLHGRWPSISENTVEPVIQPLARLLSNFCNCKAKIETQ